MSRETKWTEGPWLVTNESGRVEIDGANGDGIIGINSQSLSWLEIDDANAHLIAAAPEMYEALKRVQQEGGMGIGLHRQIDRVMAKARGEK